MTKQELIDHMEAVLAEVIEQDEENWTDLLEAEDYEEINGDKAWHCGYLSAIWTVKEVLND
jgi:hypothetical protein